MSEFFKKIGGRDRTFFIEEARNTRGKKLKFKLAIFWKFFVIDIPHRSMDKNISEIVESSLCYVAIIHLKRGVL